MKKLDFNDGNTSGDDYTYDANGNLTADNNKGITKIKYNHLNLPTNVTSRYIGTIDYIYDANGMKLAKEFSQRTGTTTTEYAGNYVYEKFRNGASKLQFLNQPEGYIEPKNENNLNEGFNYIYQYKDHLGNIRLSYADENGDGIVNKNEIREEKNYYPFGLVQKGYNSTIRGRKHKYGFIGKEEQDELSLDWLDVEARNYDASLGRWMNVDPLAGTMPSWSPYNFVFNNPLRFVDPLGLAPDDWVKRKDGSIYWDKNANDQASTKAGETYLGKTLTFTFNSYIDADLWDGPNPPLLPSPAGDKLTSTIKLTGNENSSGELTGISATKSIQIGKTPIGKPRDYFEGLGADQNKFSYSQTKNANGTLATYNLNFEQHASVSPSEEFGLNMMGFDIVNVAQQANFSLSGNNLSVTGATDVFPSATLSVNGSQLFKYNQPSFRNTHGIIRTQTGVRIPRNPMNDGFIPVYDYKHLRPAPSFYKR